MKLIVAGGRNYHPGDLEKAKFIEFCKEHNVTEIVEGGASGVDAWAKFVGKYELKLPVIEFAADWKKYGGMAGPIRNEEMAQYGNEVLLFPGGRGTASMKRMAVKYKLPCHLTIGW